MLLTSSAGAVPVLDTLESVVDTHIPVLNTPAPVLDTLVDVLYTPVPVLYTLPGKSRHSGQHSPHGRCC